MSLDQTQVDKPCTVDECDRPLLCRGVCNAHYRQLRRRGDFARKRSPECSVAGCERPHKGLGYCGMHYQRVVAHGDPGGPERLLAPDGSTWKVGRYSVRRAASHPVAAASGLAYVHRIVLFDAIGPGAHPCWGCARQVSWDRTYPGDELALVVDHIDRDPSNNAVENLRPSCQSCNSGRLS